MSRWSGFDSHFYTLTDKELADEVNKMRIALMFSRPVTGYYLRCINEVARRLSVLERVTGDEITTGGPSHSNGEAPCQE